MEAFADFFNVDLDYLYGKTDTPNRSVVSENPLAQMPSLKPWPVIGATACGDPIHRESFDETVLAPEDIHADAVFRCVGESMIGARIYDGDLVFIRFDAYVDDGGIYLVRVDDSYTLKRIYREPNVLKLVSENPKEPTRVITGPDLEEVAIVGKAVCFLSPVK
jgi:repressor LexA